MKVQSRAKINFTLDITGKDEKGYHHVQTVLQEIELSDEIVIERCGEGIVIECSDSEVPCDRDNLVFQAISAMEVEAEKMMGPGVDNGCDLPDEGRFGGVKVCITKNIPIGAGLGGGSSNAAAAMKACNEMFGLEWSKEKLAKIGAKVGTDVPFFIYGGTALGGHYGEEIEPFPHSPALDLVVLHPGKPCITSEMYKMIDVNECGEHVDRSRGLLADLMKDDAQIYGYVNNDFETLLARDDWEMAGVIKGMKDDLEEHDAQVSCLCGSGSAVYGLFLDEQSAQRCAMLLKKKYPFCWAGKTCGR